VPAGQSAHAEPSPYLSAGQVQSVFLVAGVGFAVCLAMVPPPVLNNQKDYFSNGCSVAFLATTSCALGSPLIAFLIAIFTASKL